jgi:SAM-dependent methyltransferase
MVNGILQLLNPDRSAAAGAFGADYREQRENQGWRALSAGEIAALPEKIPTNWDRLYWRVRQQSYRRLVDLIRNGRQLKAPNRVVDMGAGFGWLAARLATSGHKVVALDLNLDDAFGLGAAQRLRQSSDLDLTLVQGSIENPPIQQQQVDLLVYNASLHYASEIECTLTSGAALLRQGGVLIIMDSPVVDKATVPEWQGGRKLEKGRLLAALEGAGLASEFIRIRRTVRWQLRRLKMKMLGDSPFDLPLIIARLA